MLGPQTATECQGSVCCKHCRRLRSTFFPPQRTSTNQATFFFFFKEKLQIHSKTEREVHRGFPYIPNSPFICDLTYYQHPPLEWCVCYY